MIKIRDKQWSEDEFRKIVAASKAKGDCVLKLGFERYNQAIWRTISVYIEHLSIPIDHFDTALYRQIRRGVFKDISKEELEQQLTQKLTLKQLSEVFGCAESTVRYWIKKFGLKLFRGARGALPKDFGLERQCGICGETDPNKFYGNKKSIC